MNTFRPSTLDKLARFICGDEPLPFPYRSSSFLTSFFTGLDLDYIHSGQTRNPWVRDALTEINRLPGKVGPYPSSEAAMHAVIKEIMSPDYFDDDRSSNYDEALQMMNKALLSYNLEVGLDRGAAKLVSTDGTFVSTAHPSPETAIKITFTPKVFEVPKITPQKDVVAIMMPFGGYDDVHAAIKAACSNAGLRSFRADDLWEHDTILQDIFDLIFSSEIVIADFSGKNPNVMYETGVAHTLGKHFIPITQNLDHVPSNLQGHRALTYLKNGEGMTALTTELTKRLQSITGAAGDPFANLF
ncbi:hypothetical protein [Roseiconus lacunae]|uniref:hypothetical protein n=1 Tax=Roseiconus lacunae TaxID=2605694 RepID=UPI001E3BFD25|nr:hypothetical protein [Roseiconus lacunae]